MKSARGETRRDKSDRGGRVSSNFRNFQPGGMLGGKFFLITGN